MKATIALITLLWTAIVPLPAATPSASGDGELFSSARDGAAVKAYGAGTSLQQQTDHGSVTYVVTKKEPKADWAGMMIANLPVAGRQGKNLRISFRLKVYELTPIGSRSASFFPSLWFAREKNVTSYNRRLAPRDLVRLSAAQEWTEYHYEIQVPPEAQYLNLVFCFGYADGTAAVTDISVRTAGLEMSRRDSAEFKRALLVPRRGSPEAGRGVIRFGRSPLSARCRLDFDDHYLYCRAEVADPIFFQPFKQENIWKGDSIQIALDPLHDRTPGRFNPRDDYEFGAALVSGEPFLYPFFQPPDHPFPTGELKLSAQRDPAAGTTVYELRIPWRFLGPLDYRRPNTFGFNLLVNNNDGHGRNFIEWTKGIGAGKDPSAFGTLFLDQSGSGLAAGVNSDKAEFYGTGQYRFTVLIAAFRRANVKITVDLNHSRRWQQEIAVTPGETRLESAGPADELKNGDNLLTVRVEEGNTVLVQKELHLTRHAEQQIAAEVERLLTEARGKYEKLRQSMPPAGNNGSPRELNVSRQVAELFLTRYVKADLNEKRYRLAQREAQDLNRLLDQALEEIVRGEYRLVREPSPTDLRFDRGTLVNPDTAVFLLGHLYSNRIRHLDLPTQKALGINYTVVSGVTAHYFVPGDRELRIDPQSKLIIESAFLREQKKYHMAASVLLLTNQIPDWFGKIFPDARAKGNHFFDYDPDHPKVREFTAKATRHYFHRLKKDFPDLLRDIVLWDLANEPTMETVTAATMRDFRAAMQTKYRHIEALNRAWRTDFAGFDRIDRIQSLFHLKPVCRYDWCTFNNQRFYQFWKKSAEVAKAVAPEQIKVCIKLMNGHSWLPKFRADNGYDRELLTSLTDVNGADTWVGSEPEGPYAFPWQIQSLSCDLSKSLAPNQPIVDNEYHAVPSTPEHMRAALWLGAWHGLNGASLWTLTRDRSLYFWRNGDGETWFKTAQDTLPLVMAAYGRTGIRIGSVMNRIRHFYEAPRPVRLLYAQTALIYDGTRYLSTLEKAYQALYFQPLSVGFLGEKMLLNGKIPEDLRLLVVPQAVHAAAGTAEAVAALARRGVKILFIGPNNLTRDEADQPVKLPQLGAAALHLPELSRSRLPAAMPEILRQAGIKPEYTLKTRDGTSPDYVEARFAAMNGTVIGYAINLGRTPATFRIVDVHHRNMKIRNLFAPGNRTREEITLAPMELCNFDLVPEP